MNNTDQAITHERRQHVSILRDPNQVLSDMEVDWLFEECYYRQLSDDQIMNSIHWTVGLRYPARGSLDGTKWIICHGGNPRTYHVFIGRDMVIRPRDPPLPVPAGMEAAATEAGETLLLKRVAIWRVVMNNLRHLIIVNRTPMLYTRRAGLKQQYSGGTLIREVEIGGRDKRAINSAIADESEGTRWIILPGILRSGPLNRIRGTLLSLDDAMNVMMELDEAHRYRKAERRDFREFREVESAVGKQK